MRKYYFIKITSGYEGRDVSALRHDNGFEEAPAAASDTQQADIATKIGGKTQDMRARAGVWLRRADARRVAKKANEINPSAQYSVVEIGEFKRVVRPVLGYRFKRNDGQGEWYNETRQGPASLAAEEAKVNSLIPTRALARAALPEQQESADWHTGDLGKQLKLSIETVYADA